MTGNDCGDPNWEAFVSSLPTRARNALNQLGIHGSDALATADLVEFYRLPYKGQKTRRALERSAIRSGLSLGWDAEQSVLKEVAYERVAPMLDDMAIRFGEEVLHEVVSEWLKAKAGGAS